MVVPASHTLGLTHYYWLHTTSNDLIIAFHCLRLFLCEQLCTFRSSAKWHLAGDTVRTCKQAKESFLVWGVGEGERVNSILKNKIFRNIIHFLSTNHFSLRKLHLKNVYISKNNKICAKVAKVLCVSS
jgi:hypothetical protein